MFRIRPLKQKPLGDFRKGLREFPRLDHLSRSVKNSTSYLSSMRKPPPFRSSIAGNGGRARRRQEDSKFKLRHYASDALCARIAPSAFAPVSVSTKCCRGGASPMPIEDLIDRPRGQALPIAARGTLGEWHITLVDRMPGQCRKTMFCLSFRRPSETTWIRFMPEILSISRSCARPCARLARQAEQPSELCVN